MENSENRVSKNILSIDNHHQQLQTILTAIEASHDGIAIATPDGKHIYHNAALSFMLGYSIEEIKGLGIDYVYRNPQVTRVMLSQIIKGETWLGEVQMLTKNRAIIDVLLRADGVKDATGNITQIIGIHTDITDRKRSCRKLEALNKKLNAMMQSVPAGIVLVRQSDGIIIDANDSAAKMAGLSRNQLIGTPCNTHICPNDIKHCPIFNDVELPNNSEHIICTTDGRSIPVYKKVKKISIDGQSHFLESFIDISKLKQAESDRLAAETLYRTLFESSHDALMILDPPDWHYTLANQQTLKLFKVDSFEHFRSLTPWELSPRTQPDGQDSIEKAQKMIDIALQQGSHFFEWRHKKLTGQEFCSTVLLTKVRIDDKDVLQVTVRDITDQKRLETSLRESVQRFQNVVENVAVGIAVIKPDMHLSFVNQQMKSWFPKLDSECKQPCYMATRSLPQTKPCTDCPTVRTLKDGMVHEGIIEMPQGEETRNYKIVSTPLLDDNDNIIAAIEMVEDVTEKERANAALLQAKEAAEFTAKAKTEFLANMTHEIRTPMNVVIGMLELLSETDLNEEQKDMLNTVRGSAKSLLSIVSDILDFSKIKAGKLEVIREKFNLHALLDDLEKSFTLMLNEQSLELVVNIDPTLPAIIYGDPFRLRQVLTNLISNAIKFSRTRGGIIILVEQIEKVGSELRLQFHINDSGIGIPKDKCAKIFEAFSQVDGSSTRKYGGTGLGLSIASRLVALMDGKLTVKSNERIGSNFSFSITVNTSAAQTSEEIIVENQPTDMQFPHLLIIDNNKTNQKILSRILSKHNYHTIVANNEQQAIDICQQNQIALIFLDMQLPNCDTLQTIASIRSALGKKQVPIIAMTNKKGIATTNTYLNAGCAETISKPIDRKNLIDLTKQYTHGVNI